MTDIQKAIEEMQINVEVLERDIEFAKGHLLEYANSARSLAKYRMAVEALREKEARDNQKPCEYCANVPSRYKAIRAEGFYQTAPDEVKNPEIPVNFCPKCGRKLDTMEA